MNIVISGAAGFIGQNLCPALASKHTVFALVRALPEQECSNVYYVKCDLSSPLPLDQLPEKADAVIHLAQSNEFRNFPDGLVDIISINVQATARLLEYARESGCERFINFSTGSVYGMSTDEMLEEQPINPQGAYAVSKYAAENIVSLYKDIFNTLNIRLFFPYGKGQENMMMPNLINSVKTGKAMQLQGKDGGLSFCPTHIDDVVNITDLCLENEVTGVLNVAGNENLSLQEVCSAIGAVLNVEPKFEVNLDQTAASFRPNISKMLGLIDENKLTAFEQGIAQTIS